jgi:hypothetical protein
MHDMLNMPMNEPHLIWSLKWLLCPQELAKLKGIKHKYHMWKDYLNRNNEFIAKWNAIVKEVCERKNHSKSIIAKQEMLEDFWFKAITIKFSGKEFVKEYVWKCGNDMLLDVQP